MTLPPKMDQKPRTDSVFAQRGFLASYSSLPVARSAPPTKPLPQLPSSLRYKLFPDTYEPCKRSQTPSSISSSSPIATATLLSVSDLSVGGESWDLESVAISRPDSGALPPTPSTNRDAQHKNRDGGQGVFFAFEKRDGVVRFWVRVEHALLESGMELEGVPTDEALRLRHMARELVMVERRRGAMEQVQLVMGSFRDDGKKQQ